MDLILTKKGCIAMSEKRSILIAEAQIFYGHMKMSNEIRKFVGNERSTFTEVGRSCCFAPELRWDFSQFLA
jgi:hypothetical protein